ncbi:succinyl-diaminopimelate desuccinylase [Aureimonas altamirensis]|uniref:succinyl-diaminopimelate desuccinylase n=1 Tax=Aureimonas altamirensis TaxID=370622 RepID=UPI0030189D6B
MTHSATNPAENLAALIRCPSVTPEEGGALALLEALLRPLDFTVERPVFSDAGTPDVENLLATRGRGGRHLVFAGHTDVVPPGRLSDWRHPPFEAVIENGQMYGRGAVDMKGGIACFLAAVARLSERGELPEGQISFLITGDEEGPAINGTDKLLAHAGRRGLRFDACVVGEPTNPERMGDMIKIGRRGSVSGWITLTGRQGHVAYPHLADNPMRALPSVLDALMRVPLDAGTPSFQPSNLEVTGVDTENPSTNVIPSRTRIAFNVRHNDLWTPESLHAEVTARVRSGLADAALRQERAQPVAFDVEWRENPAEVFLTRDEHLTRALSEAVVDVTGCAPSLSTSGGTSDARFIKNYCPVVEFGLVGQTMHMSDERVALSDLETLTAIYETFISRWFSANT